MTEERGDGGGTRNGRGKDVEGDLAVQYALFGGDSPLTSVPTSSDSAAEPSGEELSTIERIMLRARMKADEEERGRQTSQSADQSRIGTRRSSPNRPELDLIEEESASSEEELPEIDIDTLLSRPAKRGSTSPNLSRRSRRYSASAGTAHLDRESGRSATSSPNSRKSDHGSPTSGFRTEDTVAGGRARRTTARTIPYSFKLSLQRPSDTRQAILDARHSAAVKTNILKLEEYKRGGRREGGSDLIGKMLRERRRENKQGIGSEALTHAMELIDRSKALLEDAEKNADRQDEDDALLDMLDGFSSTSDSSDEGSESSSRASRPHKRSRRAQPREVDAGFDAVRTALLGEEGGESTNDEGHTAVEILANDHAEAGRYAKKDSDIGISERSFWTDKEILLPQGPLVLSLDNDRSILRRIKQCARSDNALTYLLSSPTVEASIRSLRLDPSSLQEVCDTFVPWLVDRSLIGDGSDVAHACLASLDMTFRVCIEAAVKSIVPALGKALLTLGARGELVEPADVGRSPGKGSADTSSSKAKANVRRLTRRERHRRVSRSVDVCALLTGSLAAATAPTVRMCEPIFFWLLALAVDADHQLLRPKIETTLRDLLDALFESVPNIVYDAALCSTLVRKLLEKAPSTRLAYLSILPSHTLRARAFTRHVALRLMTAKTSSDDGKGEGQDYHIIAPGFNDLLTVLSTPNRSVNPLWAPRGERVDYIQLEATVGVLQFCFTDLMLHLASIKKHAREPREVHRRAFVRYVDAGVVNLLQLERQGLSGAQESMENVQLYPNDEKAGQVHAIVQQLQRLNARILESNQGGGPGGRGAGAAAAMAASEAQTRAKDALQRAGLLLTYHLGQYGFGFGEQGKEEQAQLSLADFNLQGQSIE